MMAHVPVRIYAIFYVGVASRQAFSSVRRFGRRRRLRRRVPYAPAVMTVARVYARTVIRRRTSWVGGIERIKRRFPGGGGRAKLKGKKN